MRTTALALVDLDNLFGQLSPEGSSARWIPLRARRGSAFRWVEDDGLDAKPEPAGDFGPCVVVFAANAVTVSRHGVEAPYLARFARRLARVLGHVDPGAVHWEIALTLAVPQSADRALVQLIKRAGTEAGARTFDSVTVVSDDRGLIAAVEARIEGTWWRAPYNPGQRFVCTFHRSGGLVRERRETTPEAAEPVAPASGANARYVDTPGACAWAYSQPVQREDTLTETALAVLRHPSPLSQLSVTRASFRGVARLTAGQVTLGACAPADGVELVLPVGVETRLGGERLSTAPLGHGAVRVEPLGATLHTALPPAWLAGRPIEDDVLVGPRFNRLDDAALLARAEPLAPWGWMFRAELTDRRSSLVAEVVPDAAAEVQGWWTTEGPKRPKSRCDAEGAGHLLRAKVRTAAQQAVLLEDARHELIVMAPRVERVTVGAVAPRGGIVSATCGCLPLALLPLDLDLDAGQEVRVVPIQALSAADLSTLCPVAALSDARWRALRRLPIVVASADGSGVRSGGRPASLE